MLTYTESSVDGCRHCRALGYPVPIPIESSEPGDYFRTYAQLDAHLSALALGLADIRRQSLGTTVAGRSIPVYLLGDADSVRAEGLIPEAAVLQNGGIHAREWGTPEVVAGIIEDLAAGADGRGLQRYLLDNLNMVIIPVLNVDGFLQTQRYPDQTLLSEDGDAQRSGDSDYPRDGRMRRKNMRATDEVLDLNADGMNGVDLNRNNPPFWANSAPSRSSFSSTSIVYHGSAAASEPETQALQAAADFGPGDRLRLYIDTHSFRRIYYAPRTHNARRNAILDQLAARMRQVPATNYDYGPSGPGGEIGSTDEYFAQTYEILSYTLELEPGLTGAVEYGGNGVSHDGFILPEREIARVRRELVAASLLGYYHQAGPPAVLAVEIRRSSDDALVLDSRWTAVSAERRELQQQRLTPLQAGADYRLRLQFDKPMRARDAAGQVVNYPGQAVALTPQLGLTAEFSNGCSESMTISSVPADWLGALGSRYDDDSLLVDFTLPASWAPEQITRLDLEISSADLAGQALDADPATVVDWRNGAWHQYENGNNQAGDVGGTDSNHRLIDDGSPRFTPAGSRVCSSNSGGGMDTSTSLGLLLLGLLAIRRRIHLSRNNR